MNFEDMTGQDMAAVQIMMQSAWSVAYQRGYQRGYNAGRQSVRAGESACVPIEKPIDGTATSIDMVCIVEASPDAV